MASKGKARGELTASPAVSADQLQHADALFVDFSKEAKLRRASLGRHERTAL